MDAEEMRQESALETCTAWEWVPLVPLLAATVVLVWYTLRAPDRSRLPPGPKGVPLLGYIPFLGRNHHVKFAELAKVYGPIVRVKYGMVDVIVLNDYASVRKWLSHSAFQSRLRNVFCRNTGVLGIATLNGEAWRENRRVCLNILRDNGWKLANMEAQIQVIFQAVRSTTFPTKSERSRRYYPMLPIKWRKKCVATAFIVFEELQYLCSQLTEHNEIPVLINQHLKASIEKCIMKMLIGDYHRIGDPRRRLLDRCMSQVGRGLSSCSLVVWAPSWLYNIAGYLPFSGVHLLRSGYRGVVQFVNEKIREHQEVLDEHTISDFTDAFLKETCEYRKDTNPHISVKYAAGHVVGLMGAGVDPVSNSIVWHLLNCADKPSLQNRIRQEVDSVIGRQRAPAWEDRYSMPFTMACIWETHRWRTMSPMGIPRGCKEDTCIDNYKIPKGTIVLPNLWAVHMDPNLWKNPEDFDPSRYLKEDGSGLIPKPEHLVPFSAGKRMCPAETPTNIQIFLYLTTILQNFNVMPEDNIPVDLSVDCVTFNVPKMQKLRFISRT